jgi:hypothetical protein
MSVGSLSTSVVVPGLGFIPRIVVGSVVRYRGDSAPLGTVVRFVKSGSGTLVVVDDGCPWTVPLMLPSSKLERVPPTPRADSEDGGPF